MTEEASPNLDDLRQRTSLSSIKRSRNSQESLISSLHANLRKGFLTGMITTEDKPSVVMGAPSEVEILRTSGLCPNPSDRYFVHEITGETYRKGCGLQDCPACGRTNAKRIAKAIALAQPTHLVTLTLTGTDGWERTRYRMGEFNRLQRDAHGAAKWQCAWHLHNNPRDPRQTHAHLFVRGSIDNPLIEVHATKVGFGSRISAERIKHWAYGYGLHPILETEGLDDGAARRLITEYLATNGNRPVHATHDFWRDSAGRRCTLAKAKAAATDPDWKVRVYPNGPPPLPA